MANRYFTSQFLYNFERQTVCLQGSFIQSGSTGTAASRTTQGITLTAPEFGTAGNDVTIAFTSGGTAGAEVVTVSGKAISVKIDSGVSTVNQVVAALQASAASQALALATGSGTSTVSAASALHLQGGTDTTFTSNAKGFTVTQYQTNAFRITLQDSYAALLFMGFTPFSPSSTVSAMARVTAEDVSSTKTIEFTHQDLGDGEGFYLQLMLRNSGS